ncbi:MAG: class I SAM-dependent methyltransferase [Bacteroidetes bacterium]|nr:class I SAM-dependent methyltransferase [Bacteroidota bacterium]
MKKILTGNEMDRMPGWAFKMMACMFNIGDLIKPPDNRLRPFNLQKGQTVIDYGSGTGRYLKKASEQVGESGLVYAVDIHELAIESAHRRIEKYKLKNVRPVLTDGKTVNIPSNTADVIYCLDMFHMVKDTSGFLKGLNSLIKPGGILYLEDGHQPRERTRGKVINSGCWDILAENKSFITCQPSKK